MAEPRQPADPGTPRHGVSPGDSPQPGDTGLPPDAKQSDAAARPTDDRHATETAVQKQGS